MKKRHTEAHLLAGLSDLARQLQHVKAEAAQLGIFTDDRELLECSKCGLKEDVDVHGFLLTCFEDSLGKDTGLRFKEVTDSEFRCPKCRSKAFAAEPHHSQSSH
jgi:Zn finger protein HypA/HybF involved in hydrogenase expression